MLCGTAKNKEKRKGSPKPRSEKSRKTALHLPPHLPTTTPSPANAAPKSASGLGAQVLMEGAEGGY